MQVSQMMILKNRMTFQCIIKMKKIFVFIVVVLSLFACRTSKIASIAVDAQTQERILPASYAFPKGKVCFVSTTSYTPYIPDTEAIQKKSSSFVYAAKGVEISSLKSEEATLDTLVQNRFLTTTAIETALKKVKAPQSLCIPDYEYRDSCDNLEIRKVINDCHPDALINLKALSFQVSGKSKTMAYILSTIPNRAYSIIPLFPKNELSGDVSITYSALWEVVRVSDMKIIKTIQQEGNHNSPYYNGFDLTEELTKCAGKVGMDFSKLIIKK